MTTQIDDRNASAIRNAKAWLADIIEKTAKLRAAEASDDSDAADEIREDIHNDPLSVEVRGDWYTPGTAPEEVAADEFKILLSTGGPALRIVGGLDRYAQPTDPRLQWQDWGTPWTDYYGDEEGADEALQVYCGCFYFGEG